MHYTNMQYASIDECEARRLVRNDFVYVDDDVFRVDLVPRQDVTAPLIRLLSPSLKTITVTHDRILVDGALKKRLERRLMIVNDFSRFDKYFKRNGLTGSEQYSISDYLSRLYRRTGHLWKPHKCRIIPDHTEEANEELRLSLAKSILKRIVPKRYIRSHFFWVASTNKGSFIIDPTGSPHIKKSCYEDSDIVQFFGLLPHAADYQKIVYEKMEDMDDWGTRDLPPGFHP